MKFAIPFSDKAKRRAYEASRFPSNWPSFWHNKCNVPSCKYPNPPQAADGTFNCRGYSNGSYCKGTYFVSPSTASDVMQISRTQMASEEKAKLIAVRQAGDIERQKVVKAQLDEEGIRMAADELAAKYDERRRPKKASTGSTADNLSSSAYLTRRPAQSAHPANTKPTTNTTEQQHHASHLQNQPHYLALYPPDVSKYRRPPVDIRSGQMPAQTPSRSKGSKFTTKYLPASQYLQSETQAYKYQYYQYQYGQSPSKI